MRRRSLLQGLAAAPATLLLPVAGASAAGRGDITVEAIEIFRLPVNRRGDWIIVRLRASNGLTGLGDASHGGDDAGAIRHLRTLFDRLRGRRVLDINAFCQSIARQKSDAPSPPANVAASALEQCLWDLSGKALGVPVHDLMGGRVHDRIPLYANINRSTDPRTPAGFAAMARAAIADGFDAVKLAPFDAMPLNLADDAQRNALIESGIACASAVRDAIGPGRKLLIDAHSRFRLDDGLALIKRLRPLNLYWLEEVVPTDLPGGLAAINHAAPMPTAGGEAVHGVRDFYRYIASDAVDIVMPDVKLCGGMMELRKIAAVAEGAGLAVSPHGPASPIGTLAAAHVAATLPNFTVLEHAYGEVPWRAALLDPPERIQAGSLALPVGAGFGVALSDQTLKARALLV